MISTSDRRNIFERSHIRYFFILSFVRELHLISIVAILISVAASWLADTQENRSMENLPKETLIRDLTQKGSESEPV